MKTVVLSDGTEITNVPDDWKAKDLLDHLAQQGYDVAAEQKALGPVAVIGKEGLPAAAAQVGAEGSTGQKFAGGLGTAGHRIGAGLGGLMGIGPTKEEANLVGDVNRGAGAWGTAGDIAGSIAMTAPLPASLLSRAPGAAAMMRAAPRLAPIAGTAGTSGLIAGATTPGDLSERGTQAMMAAGLSTAAPTVMGAIQGGRRVATQAGRELGRAEALRRQLGPEASQNLIPELRAPYAGANLGVRPTAAMQTGNPTLEHIELGSWTKSPDLYKPLQEANAAARWNALTRAAGSAEDLSQSQQARDAITKQMRQAALFEADQNPRFLTPVKSAVTRLLNGPTRVNPSVQTMAQYVQGELDKGIDAKSLYEIRKVLTSGFKPGDPISAAASGAARERKHLVSVIDNALNKSSGGKWNVYMDMYKTASEPVTSMRSMQAIRDALGKNLPEGDIPPVMGMNPGPQAVGARLAQFGRKQFGPKWVDRLSPEDRDLVNGIIRDLQRQQAVRKAAGGVGSDTAAKIAAGQVSEDIGAGLVGKGVDMLSPVPGIGSLAGAVLNRAVARRRDQALAEVLQDPAKLADLLERARTAERAFTATTEASRALRPTGDQWR